ncbi:MAG: hypothetical protein RR539_01490 [Clostridium sp.]|uniref:hypothetical protein n=1 Tax=Clostridium sp. TaxID=1506 RepID=UPI002FCC37F4
MGKVKRNLRNLNSVNLIEEIGKQFSVNTEYLQIVKEEDRITYKNIELNTILVNLISEGESVYLEKLVSLKAFLLSKEQGMDINTLINNINSVMSISCKLNSSEEGIVINSELEGFLGAAAIEFDAKKGLLTDSKRQARVNINNGVIDFNSIEEAI